LEEAMKIEDGEPDQLNDEALDRRESFTATKVHDGPFCPACRGNDE